MSEIYEFFKNKIIFLDMEGTLCEKPKGTGVENKVTLADLLFGNCFLEAKPFEKMLLFAKNLNPGNLYILGIVDSNNEVNQKKKWLKKYLPKVKEENLIFISSEYTKADAIECYQKKLGVKKEDCVLIDDKQSHLALAVENGFIAIDAKEILEGKT